MKKQKQDGLQLSLFNDANFFGNSFTEDSPKAPPISPLIASKKTDRNECKEIKEREVRHYNHEELFKRLAQSNFRSSFHLKTKDKAYITSKGMDVIRQHATDFVAKRLAPAVIPNDGKQTPMRGHPVFLAQHATGCCCRGCFYKWHHVPQGRALSIEEQEYAVDVLMTWIEREYRKG